MTCKKRDEFPFLTGKNELVSSLHYSWNSLPTIFLKEPQVLLSHEDARRPNSQLLSIFQYIDLGLSWNKLNISTCPLGVTFTSVVRLLIKSSTVWLEVEISPASRGWCKNSKFIWGTYTSAPTSFYCLLSNWLNWKCHYSQKCQRGWKSKRSQSWQAVLCFPSHRFLTLLKLHVHVQ